MPGVDALTSASGRDPEAALTETVSTGTPATEPHTDPVEERAGTALVHGEHVHHGSTATAPARSVRRATARRASNRRATARSRQSDAEARIVDYLAHHPGSTAGDLAKGLNLNPGSVSPRLTQLAKAGEIKKASHGYSTNEAGRPVTHQRPPRPAD